ncbi:hypothetical protein Tco_0624435 [Tanacetum coccineum]|uniref:Uncharacterized protein n=1 Tax=Tanacetum coccineum TaxID=301880 RepID=A0ABQ4WE03_9ASTR
MLFDHYRIREPTVIVDLFIIPASTSFSTSSWIALFLSGACPLFYAYCVKPFLPDIYKRCLRLLPWDAPVISAGFQSKATSLPRRYRAVLNGNFNILCAVDGTTRIFFMSGLPIIALCWDGDLITMKFIMAEVEFLQSSVHIRLLRMLCRQCIPDAQSARPFWLRLSLVPPFRLLPPEVERKSPSPERSFDSFCLGTSSTTIGTAMSWPLNSQLLNTATFLQWPAMEKGLSFLSLLKTLACGDGLRECLSPCLLLGSVRAVGVLDSE